MTTEATTAEQETTANQTGDGASSPDESVAENNAAETQSTSSEQETQQPATEETQEPISYEPFIVPEGFELDEATQGKFTELASAAGISQEQAQGLMDIYTGQIVAQQEAYNQQIQSWEAEIKALPNSDKLLADAKTAVMKLGDEATQALIMEQTPFGSHPGFVQMMAKVGAMLADDAIVTTNTAGRSDKTAAQLMYPSMYK